MNSLGTIQKMIIEDSKKQRIFGPIHLTRYHKNNKEGRATFEKLTSLGYFDRGVHRSTGDVVFVSKQYVGKK